jgi:hypothetical protein
MPFEGIVPSVTSNLSTKWLEGQFYLGYNAATKKEKVKTGSGYTDAAVTVLFKNRKYASGFLH